MTTSQAESVWVRSISPSARVKFLAALSHSLTIASRVLCHAGDSSGEAVEKLRLLNEAQHQVTGYLAHSLVGTEDPGYIPRVVDSVLSVQDSVVFQQAEQAWLHAKRGFLEREA